MTIAPKTSKPRKITRIAPFDLLVPERRPSKDVHPKETQVWRFEHNHTLKVNGDSNYLEFAWECLRRNRFYMALVDNKMKRRPETEWGYRWHKDVPRKHGLMELKPYTEGYDEGERPRWFGLDSFAESFPKTASLESVTVPITLKPGQVAIVFDLGGLFGKNPLYPQIYTVQVELDKLAKTLYGDQCSSDKSKVKSVLIRRLAMFDAITSGESIRNAAQRLLGEKAHSKRILAKKAASLFPSAVDELKTSTTAYDDADAAYDLIYRHGYIPLIGDEDIFKKDGARLRALTFDEFFE
jgi:hypothetical protein